MRGWIATLALLGGSIASLQACYGPELDSVHFHTYRPDFLRIPQPWSAYPSESHRGLVDLGESKEREPESGKLPDPGRRTDELAQRAMQQEATGHFWDAAGSWERYSRLAGEASDPGAPPVGAPAQRGGVLQRVAALRDWKGDADTEPLRQILRARNLINSGATADAAAALRSVVAPRFRWHADYLRAVMVFQKTAGEPSAAAFQVALQHSPGNILPLYMVGRSYFRAALEGSSDEDPDEDLSEPKTRRAHPQVPDAARAHLLRAAVAAYDQVARSDPKGNLGEDAAGMAAACRYRVADYAPALLHYCHELAKTPPGEADDGNWLSARRCLEKMSAADHRAFQSAAVSDPAAAGAYLDLLLHYSKPTLAATHRLGEFTLDVLRRSHHRGLSASLLGRLAVIEDRCGHPDHAIRLADTAIRALRPGTERDQVRWGRALALHHLHRDTEALAEFERITSGGKASALLSAAHQAAAVLYEATGNRGEALRHYFALDSRLDYAYLIDCLMSEEELGQYLARYPADRYSRLIRYSLGFRQLRREDYRAAEQTFASLGSWVKVAEKKCERLTSHEKPTMPPLPFARAMLAQQAREAAASAPEEKAQAAYEAGQLLFYQRHLIFYNGALWQGGRTWALEMNHPYNLRTREAELSPEEKAKLDRHQQEHAALLHAAHLFERIVHNYPRTRVAPRALYSAALSYTLLQSVEGYWHQGDRFEKKAIGLYRKLLRDYPNDPLAPAAAKYGGAVRTESP